MPLENACAKTATRGTTKNNPTNTDAAVMSIQRTKTGSVVGCRRMGRGTGVEIVSDFILSLFVVPCTPPLEGVDGQEQQKGDRKHDNCQGSCTRVIKLFQLAHDEDGYDLCFKGQVAGDEND